MRRPMLSIRAYKRQEPLRWSSCLVFLGAVALSLTASALLLKLHGKPALGGIGVLIGGAF